MNSLTEINEGNKVSARELHDFLGFDIDVEGNNAFAVENTDFTRLRIDAETPAGY